MALYVKSTELFILYVSTNVIIVQNNEVSLTFKNRTFIF